VRLSLAASLALALTLISTAAAARARQPAAPAQPPVTQKPDSLATALSRARTHQLHIFYIHGMAAGGTGDFDSYSHESRFA